LSPQRIDYYDSPDATRANSLVPSVNVVVVNDGGEILQIRRNDNGNWAVPGGAIDLGESVALAAVRETPEETGIECAITGIAGIYCDPKHVILYTSNGEARQEFSIGPTAHPLGGQPTPGSESSEVRWVPESELPGYTMAGQCASASTISWHGTSPRGHLIPRTGGQRGVFTGDRLQSSETLALTATAR
jgi:ADP-ribose pyrophosphatase YjhB (NUDIX family)